jgi:hypothetical protein
MILQIFYLLFISKATWANFANLEMDQLKLLPTSDLKIFLHQIVTVPHHPINYKQANIDLFTILDNHSGIICGVYSPSECITTQEIPSAKLMNIEHTWPQSEGANGEAKSDLHHLFVTSSSTNSIRSSLPFCDVKIVKWAEDQSKRGTNLVGENCFEPPAAHKGNVARAMFYFSIRYQYPIDSNQQLVLRAWHHADPVDDQERIRNNKIIELQNNTNPFIENPELVDLVSDF